MPNYRQLARLSTNKKTAEVLREIDKIARARGPKHKYAPLIAKMKIGDFQTFETRGSATGFADALKVRGWVPTVAKVSDKEYRTYIIAKSEEVLHGN